MSRVATPTAVVAPTISGAVQNLVLAVCPSVLPREEEEFLIQTYERRGKSLPALEEEAAKNQDEQHRLKLKMERICHDMRQLHFKSKVLEETIIPDKRHKVLINKAVCGKRNSFYREDQAQKKKRREELLAVDSSPRGPSPTLPPAPPAPPAVSTYTERVRASRSAANQASRG